MFDTLASVMRRALVLGATIGFAVGIVTGLVGLAIAGLPGLASGLVGAVLTILFLGITALGLLVSGRVTRRGGTAAMAVLMLAWFAKLIVFVIVMFVLRSQSWVVPGVLLVSIIGTVIASLVVDAVVVGRARIPVSDRV
jgi:Kef-type K+ transport system membrane component KefB